MLTAHIKVDIARHDKEKSSKRDFHTQFICNLFCSTLLNNSITKHYALRFHAFFAHKSFFNLRCNAVISSHNRIEGRESNQLLCQCKFVQLRKIYSNKLPSVLQLATGLMINFNFR